VSVSHYRAGPTIWGIGGTRWDDAYLVDDSGTIEHWDGTGWRLDAQAAVVLRSVWAFNRRLVWAVGENGFLAQFDGAAWKDVTSPGDGRLFAVWGKSPSAVWVAGRYIANGPLRFWDGVKWTEEELPAYEAQYTDNFTALGGSGPDDVWLMGSRGLTFHKTATGWSKVDSGVTSPLSGVWSAGPDAAYAVGPLAFLRWDGRSWRPVSDDPNVAIGLRAVWGSSRDDVWAVGTDGAMVHLQNGQVTRAERVTQSHLVSLWGSAPDDIWAGGEGVLLHYGAAPPLPDAGGPDLGSCGLIGSDCSKVDCCFPLHCYRVKDFLVCAD
jgi:hypothetical protein